MWGQDIVGGWDIEVFFQNSDVHEVWRIELFVPDAFHYLVVPFVQIVFACNGHRVVPQFIKQLFPLFVFQLVIETGVQFQTSFQSLIRQIA